MPATLQRESNNTYVLHVTGTLLKSEFAAVQDSTIPDIESGVKPILLAIFEDFQGWELGAEWGDLDFLYWYSHEVAKIALVAEPRWEEKVMAFAGGGIRRAPVKFFPSDQQAEARAWLAE